MGIQRELELHQFEKLNQTLFNNHPDAIYLLDLEGKFLIVNEVVCQLSGVPRELLIGNSFQPLIHPDELAQTLNNFSQCTLDIPQRYETAIVTTNGTKYIDVTNFPYKIEDRIIAIFGIAKDITENKLRELELIKNAQILKAQNEELDVLRKVIAHDLRRPVSNAIGFSKLLESVNLTVDREAEIKMLLRKSVESIDVIVRDLNEVIALKDSGKEVSEQVSLEPLIKNILVFFVNEIAASNASINLNIEAGLHVNTIKAYLQSILRNLIGNALKYHKKHTCPVIQINASQDQNTVKISVSDTGIGMDLSQIGNDLFKMHKRFAPSMADGNGLGLYIVHEQVKSLGGSIQVKSEVGVGSEFTVSLPR